MLTFGYLDQPAASVDLLQRRREERALRGRPAGAAALLVIQNLSDLGNLTWGQVPKKSGLQADLFGWASLSPLGEPCRVIAVAMGVSMDACRAKMLPL